ncbi:MAG TPA: 4Fe-4S binding protein [Polyangia bacterium]|nr:4Fe-4S binding protein [Polyangia bacterium]
MIPKIDVFKCDGCGDCVKHCPPQVIGIVKKKAAILVDLCEECGICFEACQIGAIHFRLPNQGVAGTCDAYRTPREYLPNPGAWSVGVPRGYDGEGNSLKK